MWRRLLWQFQRCHMWLKGDALVPYLRHERSDSLSDLGYLLLEYVMDGDPLSSTWQQHRGDRTRRENLYRGLSKILLDLANVPLPRIGSWRLERRGTIALANRPLLDLTMLWNRHEIPTGIPRVCATYRSRLDILTHPPLQDLTYTSADPFVRDMLAYQDHRLRFQPNSILGRPDGVFQLSALVALRALLPVFWKQDSRGDTFVLTLPDLHQSNIFVDSDWNIVGVIDLEFAPVQPQQMVNVPHWLSDKSIDELVGPALEEYKGLYDLFVDTLEGQEAARQQDHRFSRRLREDWQTGKLWYNAALRSSNAFPLVFEHNIQPRFFAKFDPDVEGLSLLQLWGENYEEFITAKIQDKNRYEEDIRAIFAASK